MNRMRHKWGRIACVLMLICLGGCQGNSAAGGNGQEIAAAGDAGEGAFGREPQVSPDEAQQNTEKAGEESQSDAQEAAESRPGTDGQIAGQGGGIMRTEFSNPIESIRQDTWYDYGTGDPYVMRHNGKYYLYMSTRDSETGIKCFSSKDMVSWKYEGLCAEEAVTKGAYAPEVVYYNGTFYMYSSPAGNGHYVFSSENPTGPFVKISENLGFSIDGSVFIDNDGKWYFYHADDQGIIAHEMTAPNEIGVSRIPVNAYMDGWTEGPMVIQHDGRYYLTYTGNHVLSEGYRINYGVGESPVEFRPGENNPVLLHTMENPVGIGHSSTVKGPDLDSYYIVYHTLTGRAVEGMPKREMNIDRIVFNGDVMEVLGPTTAVQQAPEFPAVCAWFETEEELAEWDSENASVTARGLSVENGYVLSREVLEDQFTAEYCMCSGNGAGVFGGIFCYQDEDNYGRFLLSADRQSVTVEVTEEGQKSAEEFELKGSFGEAVNLSALQAFQIEKRGGGYVLYFNDRVAGEFTCRLSGGRIGYFAEEGIGLFGFLGGSDYSGGSSIRTYEKPVPGIVQGIHYESGSGGIQAVAGGRNGESLLMKEGDYAEYSIRIAESGNYDFTISYAAQKETEYRIYLNGKEIGEAPWTLEPTDAPEAYETGFLRGLTLEEGSGLLRIEVEKGEMAVSEFSFCSGAPAEQLEVTYDSILDDNIYFDGKWRIREGVLSMNAEGQSTGKRLYGDVRWGDYTVEADVMFTGNKMDGGLMVRVSNPAQGGAGNDPAAGTCFFQGYYVGMQEEQLVLAKMNYDMEILETVPMSVSAEQSYHLEVSAVGRKFCVSVDGQVLLEYEDKDRPWLNGAVGVRCYGSPVRVDNLTVTAEEKGKTL